MNRDASFQAVSPPWSNDLAPSLPELVQRNRQNDDNANGDGLQVNGEFEQDERIAKHRHDRGADPDLSGDRLRAFGIVRVPADGHFAAVISAGVFTTGHVGPEGLDELLRVTRPGGIIVLTVKGTLWDGGFAAHVASLSPRASIRELTEPYVSMPGETATTPSHGVVLAVA